MHIHFLDPYRARSSPIHRLDPRVKFVLVVAFIFTVALIPPGAWPVYILLFSIVLSVEVVSDLGVPYVLKRSTLAFPFVLAALPLIFSVEGNAVFTFRPGPWTLIASAEGIARFASIALKSWISVQAAIVLASSTPFPDLLAGMRGVGVPRLLVAIFSLMWRYLFVLVDEAIRLLRARTARSGATGLPGARTGGSLAWRGRVAGGMAGNLFLRAFERSERIYNAMLSRGYNGEVRSLPLSAISTRAKAVLAGGMALMILLLAFALIFWG